MSSTKPKIKKPIFNLKLSKTRKMSNLKTEEVFSPVTMLLEKQKLSKVSMVDSLKDDSLKVTKEEKVADTNIDKKVIATPESTDKKVDPLKFTFGSLASKNLFNNGPSSNPKSFTQRFVFPEKDQETKPTSVKKLGKITIDNSKVLLSDLQKAKSVKKPEEGKAKLNLRKFSEVSPIQEENNSGQTKEKQVFVFPEVVLEEEEIEKKIKKKKKLLVKKKEVVEEQKEVKAVVRLLNTYSIAELLNLRHVHI